MSIKVFASLVLSSSLMAGCIEPICEGPPNEVVLEPRESTATTQRVAEVLPTAHGAVDLLFVIDDSRSMLDEQEQLGIWSRELFNVLSIDGELPDLHIAVTTTSFEAPFALGCSTALSGRFHTGSASLGGDSFLKDIATADGRERNYEGSITKTFASMAAVGGSGCGFEQPLKAGELALSDRYEENQGFLRDEALLVVVIVSDEDDCSTNGAGLYNGIDENRCSALGKFSDYRCFEFGVECADGKRSRETGERSNCRSDEDSAYISPVEEFANVLKDKKDHPGKVILAAIYGKPTTIEVEADPRYGFEGAVRLKPSCESATASANPGVRINGLLSHFPARAAQSSICEPDLSWAMRSTALLTKRVATRSHCLSGVITDPSACRVDSVAEGGTRAEVTTAIQPCEGAGKGEDGDSAECFVIRTDTESCGDTESGLRFEIENSVGSMGETLRVMCDSSPLASI